MLSELLHHPELAGTGRGTAGRAWTLAETRLAWPCRCTVQAVELEAGWKCLMQQSIFVRGLKLKSVSERVMCSSARVQYSCTSAS